MHRLFERQKSTLSLALSVMLFLPIAAAAAGTTAKGPEYLPPIPASFDPSGFSSSGSKASTKSAGSAKSDSLVKTAPDFADAVGNDSYASGNNVAAGDAAAERNDRAKDLLHQALQAHAQNDVAGAERLFKQVLSINPQNADANFNLGAMSEDRGDLSGALRYYQAAARVAMGDKDIQDALAGVNEKIRQQKLAQSTQAQTERKMQLRQIAQDAAAAYKAGNYDQAISALNQIAAQEPNDANVQYGLGQAWRGKGDAARARQYLNRALALDSGNALYRSTLDDLGHDAPGPRVADSGSMPAPAPDFRNRRNGGGNGGRGIGYGGANDGLKDYGSTPDVADNSAPAAPAGSLTPFDNSDTYNSGNGTLYGHAYGGGRGGGLGSLIGLGGLGGIGAGVAMVGGGRDYSYGGSGTRLVRRAAIGSLSGAAIGALTNMHGAGGMRSGAIRGAVTGGLFGLLTGF